MKSAAMDTHSPWDERIARARTLATSRPAAAELLTFYARLAECQKSLLAANDTRTDRQTCSKPSCTRLLRLVDLDRVLDAVPRFLSWLPQTGDGHVAEGLDKMRNYGPAQWSALLGSFISAIPRIPAEGLADFRSAPADEGRLVPFVLEAVLQPFVELTARHSAIRPEADSTLPMRCPRCTALAVAAVLREEGHGAKRSLLCALCLTEWECLRIVCPACGEQEFDKLPVYTAEQFPHVRIDACDRCGHYVKTIDLTKDGMAVPYVDDIASVSLDLWARERGYVRVKRNVLGL